MMIEIHKELKDQQVYPSRFEFLKAHNGIRPKSLVALMGTTGCLSGDSIVNINRNGCGRRYTLKELCIKFGNYPGSEKRAFSDIESNKIRSYIADEKRIGLKNFIDVVYSGEKETYTLTLESGHSLRLTACHRVQTDKGMIRLKDLSIGDNVMIDKNKRPIKIIKKKSKPLDSHLRVGIYHPYRQTWFDTRDGKERHKIEKHRAIYEANLNKMPVKVFQELTKKPNRLKYVDTSKFDIHHIDFDHKNNEISNLVKMTKSAHKKLHAEAGGKRNFNQGVISYSKIKSIEPHGIEEVFDVREVKDDHNFVANGIVVHNSGKSTLVKCIAAETAASSRVLVWLSEETIVEYQELINYLDKSILHNVVFVQEREIEKSIRDNQEKFFEYFEQMVDQANADIVFIDNVTTSRFYSSYFGFLGQQRTAEFMIDFVKRKCTIFYVAHTNLKITDNYGQIVYPGDIRGSKELPNMTEYFYIIQKFTSESKQYNVLRVAKFRHHEKASGWYGLTYERKAYVGDKRVPFALINKIFKGRDYFGKKIPVGKKKEEVPVNDSQNKLL